MLPELDYVESADYDPCREWLRMVAAIVFVILGAVAIYPIHLGVECYFDNFQDGVIDLTKCKNLFSIEYSMTVLAVSVGTEIAMIALFFYTCRHEFCGVKRRYKTSFLCCGSHQTGSSTVHPFPNKLPDKPTYDRM